MSQDNLSNANQHLTQLSEDSTTFAYVEYYLRLSLNATTAKIYSAWEVSNPQLTLQFEKRCKDTLTVDAWVDVSKLDAAALGASGNAEEEIMKRGFQLDPHGPGHCFTVGKVAIQSEDDQSGDKAIIKRFLLCKVAIGRAYNASEEYASTAAVPDQYDSFVIQKDESSDESFRYVVKDHAQILPTFLVAFRYDPSEESRSRQKVKCEACESRPAAVFCQADGANLCSECDNEMHQGKLTCRHVRVPLDQGPQTFSHCRHHPDKIVEFFCPTCSKPVCVHCKMVGHHSTGDMAKHRLITVAEAFKSVGEQAGAPDPLLAARKASIRTQQDAVNERAKQVQANSDEVKAQLEALFKRTIADLEALTVRKLNVLKGDQVELVRELSEIKHLETFLQYQQTGGNATQFILDWVHHQKLRQAQHSFPHFRNTIDVLPDIKINGSIQVHVDGPTGSNGGSASSYSSGLQGASSLADPLLQAARQSIMDGAGSRPRHYSPTTRSRLPDANNNSSKATSRRATDFLADTLQGLNFARPEISEKAQD